MNDEHDLTPESQENEPEIPADELRFAPPPDAEPADAADIQTQDDLALDDSMDIAAALAAVSGLSDFVAEQEAAEQARIAQIEAEAQAVHEAQERLEHPEHFFPVPPPVTLQRGQLASAVPALLLIVIGGWLTFTLTTTKAPPDSGLLAGVIVGALALTLLVYWLTASGGWARGMLFFALSVGLCGGVGVFLLAGTAPGLARGWPLLVAAWGLAFILAGFLARPTDRRLILPGLLLICGGAAGYVVTGGLLGGTLTTTLAAAWPVLAVVVVVILLLPVIVRRRG